jgi:CheY-like chemotaxis protein
MDKFLSTIEHTAMKLVLVVEADSEFGQLLVQAIKEETPYLAFHVTNAVQALKVARQIIPDLLLLDDRLPCMNGFELYELLHGLASLEYVPAILINGSTGLLLRDNEQRKILGLQKSPELDRLLHLIRELIT